MFLNSRVRMFGVWGLSVVSCIKPPKWSSKYVCFTSDYRVVVLDRCVGTLRPPPPPRRVCMFYDIIGDFGDPESFIKHVQPPCKLTTPCVVYKYVNFKEVVLEKVNDNVCEKVCVEPETRCFSTWEWLENTITYTHQAFGNVYSTAVFIGKKKAYVAPFSPTRRVAKAVGELIDRGYLSNDFINKVINKFKATSIYDVVAVERFGSIYAVAFNFYENPNGSYESVAMFWVSSDRVARKYALTLWDMHEEITKKVVPLMDNLVVPIVSVLLGEPKPAPPTTAPSKGKGRGRRKKRVSKVVIPPEDIYRSLENLLGLIFEGEVGEE